MKVLALCLFFLASALAFAAVTISPTVPSGGTLQLTATTGTNTATWKTTTGTITSTGPLTALFTAPAVVTTTTVTVTATGGGGSAATIKITVIPVPSVLTSVAVTPTTATAYVGATQQFTATAHDQYGNIFSGVTFTWSSSNPSAATVSSTTGLATGVAAGSTTITASVGVLSANATLTVNAVTLTSIALTPATATVAVGGTQPLVATGTYNNGTKAVLANSTLTWASSNPAAITVANGVATGVAAGTANITATSGGIISSPSVVSVPAPPALTTVTVTPTTASINVNATQQYTAVALDQYGKPITGASFNFYSSNTSVATIDIVSGLATGISAGKANITASSGSVTSASVVLTVKAISSVVLTRLSPSVGHIGMNGDFKSLTIVGTGFATGATVSFGADTLTPSAITPTTITVTIPVAEFTTVHTVNVGVTNPGTAASATLPFNIMNKGFVSMSFDDGYLSAYQNAAPIFNAANLHATWYIITSAVDDTVDGYMTRADVNALAAAGHEIGNHTETHPDLATVPQSQLTTEISGAESIFKGWGFNPATFAYPYDDYDTAVENAVKTAGLRGARTTDNYGFLTPSSPPLLMQSYPIEPDMSSDNMTSIEADINQAVSNNAWIILCFHRVDDPDPSDSSISVTHQLIQSTVDYLVQNQIPVVTVNEGMVIDNLSAQ